MRALATALLAAALLGGCDRGGGAGPVQLDILDIDLPYSGMLRGEAAPAPDEVELAVGARAGQLRAVLARRGRFDLAVFDCAAPEGASETFPVFFGGEPLAGMAARQVGSDPDMSVQLNVAVPLRTMETPGRCTRFVGRPGSRTPEIVSRISPLTPPPGSDDGADRPAANAPPLPPPVREVPMPPEIRPSPPRGGN